MEGLKKEGGFEPKTTINFRLGNDLVVEMGSDSTSENHREAAGSISAVEVVVLETSTPLAIGENALILVRGEDAFSAASYSTGPFKEVARVVGMLKD